MNTIPSLVVEVQAKDIEVIMDVMDDMNPVHVDEELAHSLGLRGCVNQGPANLGYVINMLIQWVGSPETIRHLNIRFHSISCPGDRLEARGVISELFSEGESRLARCSVELVRLLDSLDEGTELILRGTAIVEISDELETMIELSSVG
jgi:acyl dehydratase